MPASSRSSPYPILTALWLATVMGAWWHGSQGSAAPDVSAAPALPGSAASGTEHRAQILQGLPGIPHGGLRQQQETQLSLTEIPAMLSSVPSVRRDREYLQLLEKLEPENMPQLDAELTALESRGLSLPWERILFWRHWAERCPTSAMDYTLRSPGHSSGRDAVLSTWAQASGPAALAWLTSHPDLPEWSSHLTNLITGAARRDFAEAASLVLEVASQRPETAPALYATLAEQAIDTGDTESATDCLQTLAASGAPAHAIRALAEGIRKSLRQRSPGQLQEWETAQQGAAWQRQSADHTAAGPAVPVP